MRNKFDSMVVWSDKKLKAYADSQVTEKQKWYVANRLKDQADQLGFYRHLFDKGESVYVCRACGALAQFGTVGAERKVMEANHVCFHCAFWEVRVPEYVFESLKHLVIDGTTYSDAGNKIGALASEKRMMGFGGRVFTITHLTGPTWETNNLYMGSYVPAEYANRMPDNAVFGDHVPLDYYA